jgi:hypothetical protein
LQGLRSKEANVIARPYTITTISTVTWWKRPWCWIRRKPTKTVTVFDDVQINSMRINADGSVALDFTAPRVEL